MDGIQGLPPLAGSVNTGCGRIAHHSAGVSGRSEAHRESPEWRSPLIIPSAPFRCGCVCKNWAPASVQSNCMRHARVRNKGKTELPLSQSLTFLFSGAPYKGKEQRKQQPQWSERTRTRTNWGHIPEFTSRYSLSRIRRFTAEALTAPSCVR